MKSLGIVGKSPKEWVKDLSLSSLQSFLTQGFKVWAGTVGADDVLWLPANVVVLESVSAEEDTFGLRWGMVCHRDTTRMSTFTALANQKITPSTHISKHVVALAEQAEKLASAEAA